MTNYRGTASLRRLAVLNSDKLRNPRVTKEEDFSAILTSKDEWEAKQYITQVILHNFLDHYILRTVIIGLLIGTAISISVQATNTFSERHALFFIIYEQIVATIFFWEILLKWYYGFWLFWTENGNLLDFLVTYILFVGPLFVKDHVLFYVLRVLRLFRMVKSFAAIKGLNVIVQVIFQSISDMANIILLLILISLVFAVFGVILFSSNVPRSFGTLQEAMYSLFICITQDGWVQIYDEFVNTGGIIMYTGALYLFIFIIGASFIFSNIMIAIVTANLEKAITEEEEKRHLLQSGSANMEEIKEINEQSPQLDLVCMGDCIRQISTGNKKAPLRFSALENLNQATYEEFCFVLQSIQQNLLVYSKIRNELNSIYLEVQDMEANQDMQMLFVKQEKKTTESTDFQARKKLDIMNTLFPMEKQVSQMISMGSMRMERKESIQKLKSDSEDDPMKLPPSQKPQ